MQRESTIVRFMRTCAHASKSSRHLEYIRAERATSAHNFVSVHFDLALSKLGQSPSRDKTGVSVRVFKIFFIFFFRLIFGLKNIYFFLIDTRLCVHYFGFECVLFVYRARIRNKKKGFRAP